MKTQCNRILAYLNSGKPLTQFEAIKNLGILRLGARIYDLKKEGHKIKSKIIKVKNRFGETCHVAAYSLGK